MNALRTGRLGEAATAAGGAKDFLARKFPKAGQRMREFMQGVGDTARHGMEATFGAKTQPRVSEAAVSLKTEHCDRVCRMNLSNDKQVRLTNLNDREYAPRRERTLSAR